ncbi:hypothetical protein ACFQ51_14625 [Streptomyces kaempferi]
MADISFGIFVLLVMVAVSLFSVRAAWLHWTDSDRAPDAATHRYSTDPSASACFTLGSFPLLMLHATIAWFSWPKFSVPPHRRSETGSVIEWWRDRRDLRAAIKEAGQRDAQGQHSTDLPKQE